VYTPSIAFWVKGNLMNNQMIPVILTAAGAIFIMAMAFDILASNVAIFLAIVCGILAGVSRTYIRQQNQDEG
jgi:hypothetical protein